MMPSFYLTFLYIVRITRPQRRHRPQEKERVILQVRKVLRVRMPKEQATVPKREEVSYRDFPSPLESEDP
jgi:hypothetical protein